MATAPKPSSSCALVSDDEFEEDESEDGLEKTFTEASNHTRTLANKLDTGHLLYLYARYKQATEGVCNAPKPGLFDFKGKQKWEAWKAMGDLDKRRAMVEYVEKVKLVDPEWNSGGDGKKTGNGGFGVGVSRMIFNEDDDKATDGDNTHWLNAVKEGHLDMIKAVSTSDWELLKEVDEMGMTALHWAADRGHSDIVQWLLNEARVDVNPRDATGQTPLHYAYACGHETVISALIAAGADQSMVDEDGNTPVQLGDSS